MSLPQDLQNLVNSAKVLASIHDLLHTGQFPGHSARRLVDAIAYIEALHKNVANEVSNHESSHLIVRNPEVLDKE